MGNRLLSSVGVGWSCALLCGCPNPSPILDKSLAPMGPGILSSIGAGVWSKPPGAFPGSNTVPDTIRTETITNENLEILFRFRFRNGNANKFSQIFFRICFRNYCVGHAQATTAGYTPNHVRAKLLVFQIGWPDRSFWPDVRRQIWPKTFSLG